MGGVSYVNFPESPETTFVKTQKVAVLTAENKILLNPNYPVGSARKVEELINKGLIKVDGDPKEIRAEVEVALREVKGKKSVVLSDIIDYSVTDPEKLGKALGNRVPADAEAPFAVAVDKKAYDKVQGIINGSIDTTK